MNQMLHIMIPYRDREEHLEKILPLFDKYISRPYKVWAIEQGDSEPFLKGQLHNAGYTELKKRDILHETDDLVSHDVDIFPKRDNDYRTEEGKVMHLYGGCARYDTLGGVFTIKVSDFDKINGFSNNYLGYGREDDEMYMRADRSGLIIDKSKTDYRLRADESGSVKNIDDEDKKYFEEIVNHPRNEKWSRTGSNIDVLSESKENQSLQYESGLNNINYNLLGFSEIGENVTKITVVIFT